MHPSPSLVNGSVEDAINALAERSVAIAHGAPRLPGQMLEKTAFLQDAAKNVGNWWQGLNPTAQQALMGTGLGAGVGLGSSLLKDEEDRNTLGSTLTGALAGGALGTGLGMASQFKPQSKPQGLAPGQFSHGGKTYEWGTLTPEVSKRIAELQSQGQSEGILNRTAESLGKGIYNTATGPEGVAAGLTGAGIATGKYQAGKPGAKPWLQKLFTPFGQNMEASASQTPRHLRSGISKALEDPDKYGLRETVENMVEDKGKTIRPDGTVEYYSKPKQLKEVMDYRPRWQGLLDDEAGLKEILEGKRALPKSAVSPEGMLAKLKELGVKSEMGERWVKANPDAIPKVRRSLLGSLFPKHFAPHIPNNRMGNLRRVGKYGIPIAGAGFLANFLKNRFHQGVANQTLDELVRQYAKPVE